MQDFYPFLNLSIHCYLSFNLKRVQNIYSGILNWAEIISDEVEFKVSPLSAQLTDIQNMNLKLLRLTETWMSQDIRLVSNLLQVKILKSMFSFYKE